MKQWHECKHILCIRPDNLGDVLMTQPAFRAIKETFPQTKLTLLTSKMGSGVTPFMPEIDDVITFDVPWIKTNARYETSQAVFSLIEGLKLYNFDGAIIFTNFSQNPLTSALICYLANIPLRLGFCRENPYQLLTHWVPDKEPFEFVQHGVQRQLDLVSRIGASTSNKKFSLQLPLDVKRRTLQKLTDHNVTIDKPFLIVHPGASEKKRQYPPSLFAQTITLIQKVLQYQVLLTGVTEEKPLIETIQRTLSFPAISFVGDLELDELTTLISWSPLLISNNTAPVHLASATQTPVIVLYARTNPEHTPWQINHKTLYFDVPEELQSKNTVLKFTTPPTKLPMVSPEEIIQTACQLLGKSFTTVKEKISPFATV